MKWPYIAYAIAWLSTALAVSCAVYFCETAWPIWGMIIPMLVTMSGSGGKPSP